MVLPDLIFPSWTLYFNDVKAVASLNTLKVLIRLITDLSYNKIWTLVLQKSYTQCVHFEVKMVTDEQCAGRALRASQLARFAARRSTIWVGSEQSTLDETVLN